MTGQGRRRKPNRKREDGISDRNLLMIKTSWLSMLKLQTYRQFIISRSLYNRYQTPRAGEQLDTSTVD